MHRCGSHGNACSCGLFQATQPGSSFSILFAPLPHKNETADVEDPSSSLVDCTLSLGTPSTRQTEAFNDHQYQRPASSSCMSSFCWDILQSKQPTISTSHGNKSGGGASSSVLNMGSDTRRCANCDTTSTPLWRNGPRGPKSLCNACGIRYKKEERRATTSALESPNQHYSNSYHNHNQQWGYSAQPQLQATTTSPASAFNTSEFRLIQDDDDDGDSSRFLSWRLSVPSPQDFPVHMT